LEVAVTKLISDAKTTRRNVLKLAGAAALGAAGTAALGATHVRAAGSGATVDMFWNPFRLVDTRGHAKLAPGEEMVVGPFPTPGQPFHSDSYIGIVGNLTATEWTKRGWLSVRPSSFPFDPKNGAINLHFGGHFEAWSNFFMCQFGFATVQGMMSDGKFIIHNGGPGATNVIVDFHGLLGPSQ
jgi:hypothetical protein